MKGGIYRPRQAIQRITRNAGNSLFIAGGGRRRSLLDPDVSAWLLAVAGNGGTVGASTQAAVQKFCKDAKANGYWSKLLRLNLQCGNQLAAALVPLKAAGAALDTAFSFVAGDYTEATGLTGNGTSKYLKTGLVPNVVLTAENTHMAFYSRGIAAGAASSVQMTAVTSASSRLTVDANTSAANGGNTCMYSNTTGILNVTTGITPPAGMVVGSRVAVDNLALYRNGVSLGTLATGGGTLPTTEIFIMALNSAGTPVGWSSGIIAGYSIGAGLTAGDVAAYYTDMLAFQTALGRAV